MSNKNVQGVSYTNVSHDYFEKRGLQRHAGLFGLWALGVAAVVSGDFSGWNFGIGEAGWGGLLIATLLVVVMYFGMIFSIGEMASALPHTGGAYSFARSAMGPWGGFVTGFAETIEYVATTGVIVFFSASYADGITKELFDFTMPVWAWWIILYAIFLVINIAGVKISFKFSEIVAVASLIVLGVFAVMALFSGKFSIDNLFNITPTEGNTEFLPFGFWAIVAAMPFAMWFFLGIEELPLAAEEAENPSRDIPKAGIRGLITLCVTATMVLILNPGITGADQLKESGEPLLDGFRAILPNSDVAALLAAFALIGLFASLQGIMFAYGRNIYSLSRAGYFPKVLSLTGTRKTPWTALIVGAIVGYGALLWAQYGGETAGAVVLNIAVWGAVLAYLLQMISYLLLKRKYPNLNRPYKSPVGSMGAIVAAALALLIFIGQALNEGYRSAIIAIAVVYVLGLLGFALFGRKKLVLSPEEEAAIKGHQ
ncbi:MAG: amino acid permease [Actinobacteria bacterium]|nr:amino acid permease [Actinomycetota bacterium]